MSCIRSVSILTGVSCLFLSVVASYGQQTKTETPIENAFQLNLIVQDTNGDQIADAICGHVVVPKVSSSAENAAAANIAARLGYETSALSLPVVITTGETAKVCSGEKASIWVGKESFSGSASTVADKEMVQFGIGEGGVFTVPGGLLVVGTDASGLLAAADAYSARAPYQWSVQGEKLQGIARIINARLEAEKVAASVELVGVTYQSGQAGIRRAVVQVTGTADAASIKKALDPGEGESPLRMITAREIELRMPDGFSLLLGGGGLRPGAVVVGAAPSGGAGAGGDGGEGGATTPRLLDLHELFGIHGLLTGNQRNLVPQSVSAKLYVPAGESGVAMANLAARLGLETTGITLPIALPDTGISTVQIRSSAVISGETPLAQHAMDLLGAPAGTALDKILAGQFSKDGVAELPALKPGEGELQVVDRAFGINPALLVRGDTTGTTAALDYASQRLPYLWEPSKKFVSLEEMRLDLAKFFSLRSSAGQATTALFLLDQWMDEAKAGGKKVTSASAEVDVDEFDPKLAKFVRDEIAAKLKTQNVQVKTGNLHAGTKCCDSDPDLHNISQVVPFKQAEPTFRDDFTIPWEGKRMMEAVRKASANLPKGQTVKLEVRVSEGPEERVKIKQQLMDLLKQAGADPAQTEVTVLCSYKSGYSWLVDEIQPMLKDKGVAKIKIEFAPYPDPTKQTTMRSLYRWNQELFPVDEVLAKNLQIPLKSIEIAKMDDDKGPTYRVYAYGADGKEILSREFTVKMVSRPYNDQFPEYETVTVETGWVTLTAGGKNLLDERVPSDIEMFWDHYQSQTLPRIFKIVMAQYDGKPRVEFQPLFDTLKVSYKLSEPDYQIGIEQERISSLEALQEDTFFNTENFFYMFGDLVAGGRMDYQGRIIPVSYPSRDGEDGEVHIEFYAKDAGPPKVQLTWKTDDSAEHERERDLAAIPSAGHMRLVAARVQAGKDNVTSLTWRMPVDFNKYNYDEWIVLAEKSRVDRTISSSDQAVAQVTWLQKMHSAGLYLDSLTYPHLASLGFEFELPVPMNAPEHAKKEIVTSQLAVVAAATKRPMIADFKPTPLDTTGHFVQWDNPISPEEEEHLLSRLATYPGVDVYWMGRTYLGRNIWAADMTLPTPSTLTSMPKATTLKATIIYSGRQHANEVSSTSHLLKLGEELVLDANRRKSLEKVNVVLHPITNVDGAELAIDLAKISPHNMLHPAYHASLTADVTSAQNEEFPVYPESATRRLLWNAWLPDAFLNPHGYPTHEWVQPFSEYSAWITTRVGAETGRTNWVPRGWFTSLGYLGDDEHPDSRTVTYALREKIVGEMAKTPGVLELNAHENDRYERYQRWDAESYQQPIYKGVRINMALKGQDAGGRGNTGANVGIGGLMVRYPEITYDDGYTEAPDETAYGDFLHLVASAGLAYDHAHLDYLTEGKLNVKRTQRDVVDGVTWQVERKRPIMPLTPPISQAEGVKQ
jgi:Zinc carboxypeptidase